MALGDPFSATLQATLQGGERGQDAAMAGISTIAQQKQKQKAWANVQQMIGTAKQTQAVTDQTQPLSDEEYLAKAEPILAKVSSKLTGSQMAISGDKDASVRRQQIDAILKPLGLSPQPQKSGTLDVGKMSGVGSGGFKVSEISTDENGMPKVSFKPVNEELQAQKEETMAIKEQTMEMNKERLDEYKQATDARVATEIATKVNPTTASPRSGLGQLGNTTIRAKRAIDILNDPSVTTSSQVMSAAENDIAGIIQGGAPTQQGMNEQDYNTVLANFAKLKQFATAHPEDAAPPEIKQQLLNSLNSLNNTGKQFIQNNLKTQSVVYKDWIKNHPDQWKDMLSSINDEYGVDSSGNDAKNITKMTGTNSQNNSDYQSYIKKMRV